MWWSWILILLLLLLLLLLSFVAEAAQLSQLSGGCIHITAEVMDLPVISDCVSNGFLNSSSNTWFATGENYQTISSAWRPALNGLSYLSSNSGCYIAAVSYICQVAFHACANASVDDGAGSTHYPVPTYVCQDICNEMESECEGTDVAPIFDALIDCANDKFPTNTSIPAYAVDDMVWVDANGNSSQPIACAAATFSLLTVCPPLFARDSDDECVLMCGFPVWSWSQKEVDSGKRGSKSNGIYLLRIILLGIAIPCCLFSMLTFHVLKKKHQYPSRLIFYLSIVTLIYETGQLLSYLVPEDNIACITEGEYAISNKHGACFVQGLLILFSIIASFGLWMGICMQLYFIIVVGKPQEFLRSHRVIIYSATLGVSFVLALVAASSGSIQYSNSLSICFVKSEALYSWGFLNAWMFLFLAFATPFTIIVIWKIRKEMIATHRNLGAHLKRRIPHRMVIFSLYFNVYLLFFFIFQALTASLDSQIQSSYEKYINCQSTLVSIGDFEGAAACKIESSFTSTAYYGFAVFTDLLVYGQGIFLFFLLTYTPQNGVLWMTHLERSHSHPLLCRLAYIFFLPLQSNLFGGDGKSSEETSSDRSHHSVNKMSAVKNSGQESIEMARKEDTATNTGSQNTDNI